MKCQACNGEVSIIYHEPSLELDLMGTCKDCAGVYVKNQRKFLATWWCKCPDTTGQEIFFFSDNGGHGWLHTVCGQVTQTG